MLRKKQKRSEAGKSTAEKRKAKVCREMRRAATENGCRIVDISRREEAYDSIDGLHPTRKGMKELSRAVLDCLREDGISP